MQGSVWGVFLAAAAAVAVSAAASCAPEGGHPPVARAEATPATIPEHDGFQTEVTLDASTSSDPLDDPDGTRPLRYRWRILGDEFRFESGTDQEASPVVSFRGDRPATIELTVTDEDGDASTTSIQMQLTVRP